MTPPEAPRDLYELYALGLLEEPERSQVAEELRLGSPESLRRMRQALETNSILMAAVPLADPPARLRKRVLAAVGVPKRSHWFWAWAATAAAAVMGAVYLGQMSSEQLTELAQVRASLAATNQRAAQTDAELLRMRSVLSLLNAPETRMVTFGPKDPKPPRGRVLLNPNRGVLLLASNLPPAPAGKIYEMWIIAKGRSPVPAGLFQTDSAGNGMHFQEGPVDSAASVAVTLEPESGSPQPTSAPLFVAAM